MFEPDSKKCCTAMAILLGVLAATAESAVAFQVEIRPAHAQFEIPDQVPAEEGTIRLPDGGELGYWDTGGDGETLVLLHPASMSGAAWPFQQPIFANAGYRVIGYSRRGYIGSTNPSEPSFAADDLNHLFEQVDVERAHIVAAAHGGSYAVDFALSYPEKVRSLTLASSLIGIDEREYVSMLNRLLPRSFSQLPRDFRELGPAYRAENPAGAAEWNRIAGRSRNKGTFSLQARRNRVVYQSLRSIEVPVLIVGGEADLYAPAPLLRLQAANFPNANLELIREAGHSAYWERPEMFNNVVLRFLETVN